MTRGSAAVDLTIRGGGIFGLAIAWEAVRRGARVRLLETARIGAGSSGGIIGALAPHTPDEWNAKKAFQLQGLLIAEDFWAEVTAACGLGSGYARTGRLQPLADDTAISLARSRVTSAETLWQGQARWQVIPATGAAWAPPSPTGLLIHDTLTARLHPRLALAALSAAIRAKGGEVIENSAEPDPPGPIIWATGVAGLEMWSTAQGRKIGSAVKGQAILLGHHAASLPQIFVDGLHIVPHADGTLAIGSTSEIQWSDTTSCDAQLDELLLRALTALPILANAPVLDRWASLRPRAKTRSPLLGAWPGRPGHFIANGGFKIGFGIAPMVARVMVDLALDGHNSIPKEFSPQTLLDRL